MGGASNGTERPPCLKKTRHEDPDLIQYIKENLPCISCERSDLEICAHHVKTRGSGGPDRPYNLMPLCLSCHTTIHAIGLAAMSRVQKNVKKWLVLAGWEFDEGRGKWTFMGNENMVGE